MSNAAITFDFHDTLATCERWFQLEINDLVPAFLRWRAERANLAPDAALEATAHAAYRRLRRDIMDHGAELPAEECVAVVLRELGIGASADEIAAGVAELMRATVDDVEPIPGAVETVQALHARDIPLGVVSNAVYHPFLEWSLDRFGLRDAFAVITTSASVGFYKSRPEIFRRTLAALEARPEASIHVGDSHRYDIGGAKRAGMKTVWLQRQPTHDVPPGPPPDLTVTTLVDLAPKLLDLLDAG